MSDFAKNIKRRRLELGLSQEQLAEKLAVTHQTVSNWERSVSFPDLQMLGRIAEALGTDPIRGGRAQGGLHRRNLAPRIKARQTQILPA